MQSAVRKPDPVSFIVLDGPAKWGEALGDAGAMGYRGKVEFDFDTHTGDAVWGIELNGPGNPKPVIALLGDVLVTDGTRWESMGQAEFAEKYDLQ